MKKEPSKMGTDKSGGKSRDNFNLNNFKKLCLLSISLIPLDFILLLGPVACLPSLADFSAFICQFDFKL